MKKQCSILRGCGLFKPLTEFHTYTNGTPRGKCKDCNNKMSNIYHHANKTRLNEDSRLYYQNNKCRLNKISADYRVDNKERVKLYARQYYIDNKNIISTYKVKYQIKHKEKLNKISAEYRVNNKELLLKTSKKWQQSTRGVISAKSRNSKRRALKKSTSDNTIDIKSLSLLKESQNNKCYHCEKDLDFNIKGSVHLDHLFPLSKGGVHSITNVVWSCARCNLSKGAKVIV